ncbi:amino acid transporter [Scopulibacillus daqui]|uniref:Amino acid transporter n=1 Tax=Scopulibacillus daqui TaxID=1469162 RepID=A0ABS2Q350_9BACL|nr:APC family permease [Scopulibacillus daqui]MBM7646129.1 amino acid transporter [Scopulibacillus daqui]
MNLEKQSDFKRKLNVVDLTLLGLGSIIGSAWLFSSQIAATYAGPAAAVSWVLGALAIGLLALTCAELGGALPHTGGLVRYPNYSHGPILGYLSSFMFFIATSVVPGLEVEGMRTYASQWFPSLGAANPTLLGWFVQFAILIIFFLLNYWSVNVFGKVNSIITFLKFVIPIMTVIVLLTQLHPANFHMHGFAPFGFSGIESAVSTAGIAFAFMGFQQPIIFGSEAKNPGRTIPLAVLLSLGLATILYLFLQFSFVGALPDHVVQKGWSKLSFSSPFADLAVLLGLAWLANTMLADAVLSTGGTANIYMGATARGVFAWSKNGTFFKIFAKVDKKTGVPRPSLWFTFILSVFWTAPFPSWDKLINVASSAAVLSYILIPISVVALRRSAPDLHRPFKLKGISIIGPLSFLIASFIVYWTGWQTISWLIGLEMMMFIGYLFSKKIIQASKIAFAQQIKSSIWLIVYCLAMIAISYLGTFGGRGILPAPWDQIAVIIISLAAYYWGVASALSTPAFEESDGVELNAKKEYA